MHGMTVKEEVSPMSDQVTMDVSWAYQMFQALPWTSSCWSSTAVLGGSEVDQIISEPPSQRGKG